MSDRLYYDILDKERLKLLPLLKEFGKSFYLAGGTALALQIGHRDSIDFDFFSLDDFSTRVLFKKIEKAIVKHSIKKIQEEENTLSVLVDNRIKISFFTYKYKLIEKLINAENVRLASVIDIGCMKLSAIVARAVIKDYVDIYFILQKTPLKRLLNAAERKFPDIDINLILKSLVFFNDIEEDPIIFKHGHKISFQTVKLFLSRAVAQL